MGVEIIKLESKFDGYWYCGRKSTLLRDVKRPYFIWVIGDQRYLAKFNKAVPVDDIIGGIKQYSAYATAQPIPFDIEKKSYVVNHTGLINVNLLVNLSGSLQESSVAKSLARFKASNPSQTNILSVSEITDAGSIYSHVIELEIANPTTLKTETITYSYPQLATWVSESDDTTGDNVMENLDKTTGLMSLIRGVSEAFKNSAEYGSITFNLKNK